MPGGPRPVDVRFDRAAAQAALDECESAERKVGQVKATKIGLAVGARDEWTGPFREDFDTEAGQFRDDSQDLQQRLTATAGDIRDAMESAATEQTRRAQAQEDWDAEAAREAEDADDPPDGPS